MHVRNGDRYAAWVYQAGTARDCRGHASIARGLGEVKSLMRMVLRRERLSTSAPNADNPYLDCTRVPRGRRGIKTVCIRLSQG